MRVVIMGVPGAGKGTQASLLAERLGVPHIASGDLFRRHQRDGTALGKKARDYVNQGLLVPDGITISMVLEEVLSPQSREGFILDGFPRNVHQAESLQEALASQGEDIDLAILIDVDEAEIVSRLSRRLVCEGCQAVYHALSNPPERAATCDGCGGKLVRRADDEPEAISRRLQVHRQQAEPVVSFYRKACKLAIVDGVGDVEEIHQRIERTVRDRVPKEST